MTEPSEEFLEKALSAAFALDEGGAPTPKQVSVRRQPEVIPERIGRYQVEALVGRGGIGLVLRVRDLELDRPVALKILHEHLRSDADMDRRFVEEARVGGGLEHPGVVPVHEMGRTADGRPYFTMKLVEGDTLAATLAARVEAGTNRLGFLAVFEKICQITAYAHARGVVHLDLKPSNVLVGGFGEILVTDWGFAATVTAPAAPQPGRARIVGTPAYMAPEQARGDLAVVGPRSDVFALGAILCEILTGSPPYEAESASETLLAASRAWLDSAWARLESCSADPMLVSLARRCLAPAPADRPADAGVIAAEVGDYLRSLEERTRALQIEAAQTKARAAAERRQMRLRVALAAALALAAVVASGAWLWVQSDRARRAREDDRVAVEMGERARVVAERARAAPEPAAARWDEPLALARQAAELARTRGLSPDLRQRLERLEADTAAEREAAARNERLLHQLDSAHEQIGTVRFAVARDQGYSDAFRAAGLDLDALGAAEAADAIAASPVRMRLVMALDDWIDARKVSKGAAAAEKLVAIVNRSDPDGWRIRVRSACAERDVAALEKLVPSLASESAPPESWILLALSLKRLGRADLAASVLDAAETRHPGYYDIHHELGVLRRYLGGDASAESIRQFSMALAVRPGNVHALLDLGQAFLLTGSLQSAEKHFEEARRIDPRSAEPLKYLGAVRWRRNDLKGAEEMLRASVDLDPANAHAHLLLSFVFRGTGRNAEAAAACRAALKSAPEYADAWSELGHALVRQGSFSEARTCFEKCGVLENPNIQDWDKLRRSWLADIDLLIEAEKDLSDPAFEITTDLGPDRFVDLGRAAWFLGRHATSARLYSVIVEKLDPAGLSVAFRLFSARALASGGTGGGTEPVADEKERGGMRSRALNVMLRLLDSLEEAELKPLERAEALQGLDDALSDPAFAGVRDADRISDFSAGEKAAWQALWDRARALAERLRAP